MNERNSLRLRAQEILIANPIGMSTREAMKRALAERFKDDPAGLLEFAASASDAWLKDLRQRTYELQEPGTLTLFDPPPVIGISTPEGDFIVSTDVATVGQIRQWERERRQWIATQTLRGKRFREQSLEPIADVPDDTPWAEARLVLRDRRVEQLEAQAAAASAFDIETEEGQANREALLSSIAASMDQYKADSAAGVDAEEAAKRYAERIADVERKLLAAGRLNAQVDELIGRYRNIQPPDGSS